MIGTPAVHKQLTDIRMEVVQKFVGTIQHNTSWASNWCKHRV